MSSGEDDLLRYFQQEMAYLREKGAAFAERYPKVAARLELGGEQSPDPHVERLIESFAFLTARLQHDIDDEFPEITAALLGILYPQLINPVPSMGIAHMQVDPTRIKLTSGYTVPKATPLFAEAEEGAVCWFRTCYRTTLFPFAVRGAHLTAPDQLEYGVRPDTAAVLALDLASLGEPLAAYRPETLRFFLKADPILTAALYELLVCKVAWIGLRRPGQDSVTPLPGLAIEPGGLALDEDVLPYPPHAQPAYRLLQEYAEFPEKFHFVDVRGLDFDGCGHRTELVMGLTDSPPRQMTIGADNFLLGCTPVINLFRKLSEPIRLTERATSYWLIPDLRRRRIAETHSILSVSASADPDDDKAVVAPFYSFDHDHRTREPSLYWLSRRRPTGRADLPGTEMHLSFVDRHLRPTVPPHRTVFAQILCTNRTLAEQMPDGQALQFDAPLPVTRITCLRRPTVQRAPILDGGTAWRLVSQLSLNHLSLSDDTASLRALRELLRLYGGNPLSGIDRQAGGLTGLSVRAAVRQIGQDAWRGFVRGKEISLEVDERAFPAGSAVLLSAVLNHFFALYASVNSFTELVVRSVQRPGEWKRWPPMIGNQRLI